MVIIQFPNRDVNKKTKIKKEKKKINNKESNNEKKKNNNNNIKNKNVEYNPQSENNFIINTENLKERESNNNKYITEKEFKEMLYPILDNNLTSVKKRLKNNITYEIIKNRYFELIFDKDFAKYLTKHIYLDILYNEEEYKNYKNKLEKINNLEERLEKKEKEIEKGVNFKNLDYAAKSNEYF